MLPRTNDAIALELVTGACRRWSQKKWRKRCRRRNGRRSALATSEVVAEAEFGGLFISQRHRQTRDDQVSFETHNMFGFDPSDGSFKLWQFDSMGFGAAVAGFGNPMAKR